MNDDPAGGRPPPSVDARAAATWSWDVASGAVGWSDGIEAIFGLPPGGFAGTYDAYLALVHPDDRAHFEATIARTLEGEDEYAMSHRVIWPDGSVHWIDGRARVTRDERGRAVRLDGVSWDARARKIADARDLHLRLVQTVATAVMKELLRAEGDLHVFERACRIAVEDGRFRFAWVGLRDGAEHVVPVARAGSEDGYLDGIQVTSDGSPRSAGPVGRCIREGRVVVVNDVARDPGFAPWREAALARGYRGCAAFPLRRGGNVVGALAIYTAEEERFDPPQIALFRSLADDMGFALDTIDEAARRRDAERAMRQSEERFRAIFEQASDAIFVGETDGRILDANPAACAMTGFSRDELRARSLGELLGGPIDPSRSGPTSVDERRLRRKDGDTIDAEVSVTALAGGRVQAHVRDVTLRKRVQRQLVLADRLASLGRLAAGVAHEVNNPLAYLTLNLERIDRATAGAPGAMTEEVRSALASAQDATERVRKVVRALGALGRDEEEGIGAVDLHRSLDAAVRLAESRVRHRGRIVTDYRAARGVSGTDLRLTQVFVNLLVNAADALRDDRAETNEIRIRTFDEGPRVVVEVSDDGVGIAEDVIGRIFDPFFTTKPVGEGTGLGLSICHGIVAAFGGTIAVESTPGRGSTFRVALLAATTSPPKPVADPQKGLATRTRILIVDDEARLAKLLAASLDAHDVAVATSGREAIALCEAHDYDLVLCDLMMPGVSGIDAYEAVRRNKPTLAERFAFMTGGAYTTAAREFLARVPNLVLEKPFDSQRVERAIEELAKARR